MPQTTSVYLFNMLKNKNPSFDAYTFIRSSKEDGSVENALLLSTGGGYDWRVSIGGEPGGPRGGIGNHIYRALYVQPIDYVQTQANLRKLFFGFESNAASASYSPAYGAFDRGVIEIPKTDPFYFSPANCEAYVDDDGRGYHVFHFLESVLPPTAGWLNLL